MLSLYCADVQETGLPHQAFVDIPVRRVFYVIGGWLGLHKGFDLEMGAQQAVDDILHGAAEAADEGIRFAEPLPFFGMFCHSEIIILRPLAIKVGCRMPA